MGEYCHAEIFRASCSDDEVILVERALYGRMSWQDVTPVNANLAWYFCHAGTTGEGGGHLHLLTSSGSSNYAYWSRHHTTR